jgi:hypothetical protein
MTYVRLKPRVNDIGDHVVLVILEEDPDVSILDYLQLHAIPLTTSPVAPPTIPPYKTRTGDKPKRLERAARIRPGSRSAELRATSGYIEGLKHAKLISSDPSHVFYCIQCAFSARGRYSYASHCASANHAGKTEVV